MVPTMDSPIIIFIDSSKATSRYHLRNPQIYSEPLWVTNYILLSILNILIAVFAFAVPLSVFGTTAYYFYSFYFVIGFAHLVFLLD